MPDREFRVTRAYRHVENVATITVSMRVMARDHLSASDKVCSWVIYNVLDRSEDWRPIKISVQDENQIEAGELTGFDPDDEVMP